MEGALAVLAETQARVAGVAGGEGTVGRVSGDNALYQGLVGTVVETSATVRSGRAPSKSHGSRASAVRRATRLVAVVGGLAALAHNATGA